MGKHFSGKVDKKRIGKRRRNRNASYLKKRSTTDPDATVFYRPGMGNHLSYKAHLASSLNGFVTAVYVIPSSIHDTGGVPALVESHERILGIPFWIAADTKYGSEECLKYLQEKGIKTSIKPEEKNSRPGHFSRYEFSYDKDKDSYICPNGKILKRKTKSYTVNRIYYKANSLDCATCPKRDKCISGKAKVRIASHYDSRYFGMAKDWYYSKFGRNLQKLRSTIMEGIMGQAKEYHGMDKAKLRGISKVEIQFLLTATAINLKKMVKMMNNSPIFNGFDNIFAYFVQFVDVIIKKLKIEFAILRA